MRSLIFQIMLKQEISPLEYSTFYKSYLDILPEKPLSELLRQGLSEMPETLELLKHREGNYAYAPGKWSVADVILHLTDSERIFLSRALWFAREPGVNLPGFDQDIFVRSGNATSRNVQELAQEWQWVRQSSIALYDSFTPEVLLASGSVEGNTMSVRALGFIICGHVMHHLRILRDRYQ